MIDVDLHSDRNAAKISGIPAIRDRVRRHVLRAMIDHRVEFGIDRVEPRQSRLRGFSRGYIDCAEAIGLDDLNPQALPKDKLVADLIAEVEAKRLTDTAVTRTLRQSADWLEVHPTLETWFEDNANVAKAIGTRRAPRAKQIAVLLAGPLQSRRRRWAELAAWMALSLKHRRQPGDWQAFAILARELLGSRLLDEIGLMKAIAGTTLAVMGLCRD